MRRSTCAASCSDFSWHRRSAGAERSAARANVPTAPATATTASHHTRSSAQPATMPRSTAAAACRVSSHRLWEVASSMISAPAAPTASVGVTGGSEMAAAASRQARRIPAAAAAMESGGRASRRDRSGLLGIAPSNPPGHVRSAVRLADPNRLAKCRRSPDSDARPWLPRHGSHHGVFPTRTRRAPCGIVDPHLVFKDRCGWSVLLDPRCCGLV